MRVFILGLLLFLTACASAPDKTVWIDVRSASEYADGHIAGAVNIPHTEIAEQITTLKLDKDTKIALYCGSGRRAGIALETLQQLGYTNLTNEGGYKDLKKQQDNERQ